MLDDPACNLDPTYVGTYERHLCPADTSHGGHAADDLPEQPRNRHRDRRRDLLGHVRAACPGTLAKTSAGLVYTPDPNTFGLDGFTYEVTDRGAGDNRDGLIG